MTIRVPNTLTVDNSEKYEVSIRLWPGGLSFSGYIPSEENSFFTETALFDNELSTAQSLKNLFFANPCFAYTYRRFVVMTAVGAYTFVPDEVYLEKNRDRLFAFCHSKEENRKILSQPLEPFLASLLFELDNDVYEFLVRSLENPQFIHCMSPLLAAWGRKSRERYPKQMYAYMHEGLLDMACFEQGELLFANSFDCETEYDALYYITYVCKLIGMDQLADHLYFCGDKQKCFKTMGTLKKYIEHTDYMRPHLENYKVAVDREVYIDVLTLISCGL
jgi:hypothetical protein